MKDSFGDRMKRYEDMTRIKLMPRMPAIIRLDGRAFHTLTRNCVKPFDHEFMQAMQQTAITLVEEVQNVRLAYVQSDEISLLLVDYNKYDSQQWFDGNISKILSISASIASVAFSKSFVKTGYFDSRVFTLPEHEVVNYFIWRQQDATRNSINTVAQSLYSPKQLHGVSCKQAQEMISQNGLNWNDFPTVAKRGSCVYPWGLDFEIPVFTQDRSYIEKFLEIEG